MCPGGTRRNFESGAKEKSAAEIGLMRAGALLNPVSQGRTPRRACAELKKTAVPRRQPGRAFRSRADENPSREKAAKGELRNSKKQQFPLSSTEGISEAERMKTLPGKSCQRGTAELKKTAVPRRQHGRAFRSRADENPSREKAAGGELRNSNRRNQS